MAKPPLGTPTNASYWRFVTPIWVVISVTCKRTTRSGCCLAGLSQQLANLGADAGFDFFGALAPTAAHGFLQACEVGLAGGTVIEVMIEFVAKRQSQLPKNGTLQSH